ncbi:hypothetical protein [Lapillicoccus sp.]|uniref:hypothetical protein n=1 Tax=Lapillicoccus sp. TaxID=1909287 RepID=UPI003983B71C
MRSSNRRIVVGLGAGLLSLSLAGCATVVGVTDAPTATVGGALPSSQAQAIATQVVAAAEKATTAPGAEGDAVRATAFSGMALTAASADAKLAATVSAEVKNARTVTASPPVVLAVSRGLDYPRSMVVQTTRAQSGLPVLHLLTTPDVRTSYRIAASTLMLPSAAVKAFDKVAQGSPVLGDGSSLAVRPEDLTKRYAASLAFPAAASPTDAPPTDAPPTDAPFSDDTFATGVRASAVSQSQGLANIATLTQQHDLADVIGGLRVAGGKGALVFTVLDRRDSVVNKPGAVVTPLPAFTALTGLTTVTAEASQHTLEFVAFFVPERGQAVVVGAEEHLVAASGT